MKCSLGCFQCDEQIDGCLVEVRVVALGRSNEARASKLKGEYSDVAFFRQLTMIHLASLAVWACTLTFKEFRDPEAGLDRERTLGIFNVVEHHVQ
ncbi:MAG: hypothetical protein J0I65_20895 [Variovorax sp.]|uniref:Uncharacterized protein n=1 Tax=Variovorax paradoxus TaxID=34073 RepID=A0A2W5QHH6_VARPD|nr:hypothetical protein [Variovorax sp.]PZQ76752.1 MAG: hypothetical protein DI563_06205 [Variovorax paradoxus]|tara:strand:- start:1386 stop:1670 length:285 start_codon:yes stop_codon:yes gene_type:complete